MAEEEGTVMKAPTFDGQEASWQEWSFVMRAYLAGKLKRGQELVSIAEGTAADISNAVIVETDPALGGTTKG